MKPSLCDPSVSSESLWLLRATGRSARTRIQMAYRVANHARRERGWIPSMSRKLVRNAGWRSHPLGSTAAECPPGSRRGEAPAESERVSGHYAWIHDGGRLVQTWNAGSWSKEHAEQEADAAAGEEPPASEPEETPSARPAARTFWVAGNWAWDSEAQMYRWDGGRWIDRVDGESWVYGAYRWEKRNGRLVRVWQKGYFAPPSSLDAPTP